MGPMGIESQSAPWAQDLLAQLDAHDRRATALVHGLTHEQLNQQPSPGAWSVGQCLAHLCEANDHYIAPMRAALTGQPEGIAHELRPGWFGGWFIANYIEPSGQTKRSPAPKKIRPADDVPMSVLQRFLDGNQAARALITEAARHDVNRLRFANPFLPLLKFRVSAGLLILVRHQDRHLLQAERVPRT